MAKRAEFHVEGLTQTMAALAKLDKTLGRELQRELKRAADIVVNDARNRVPSSSGAAAGGIRSRSSSGGMSGAPSASVVDSGDPSYLQWLDFGSRTPRTGNTRAEGPWRGSGAGPKGGRFLYPAIEAKDHEITAALLAAIERAEKEVGF